jgi:VCBS repeat-containing protein
VIDVLGNDTDPDRLDVLTVSADATSQFDATIVVNADGSISYDPREAAALQNLASGVKVTDSFSYTIKDLAGASSTATVSVEVTGLDDASSAIRVALLGATQAINVKAATLLTNNDQGFAFEITTDILPGSAFALDAFTDFDVVVIGEDGVGSVEMDNPSLITALSNFVTLGGGVVSTGNFARYDFGAVQAAGLLESLESISPVKVASGSGDLDPGSQITVTPLDSNGQEIAGESASYSYFSQTYLEKVALTETAIDDGAKVLATASKDSVPQVAIAYDEVGAGRTVYLATMYMHPINATTQGSTEDELFERAVAWAAGDGTSTLAASLTSAASFEESLSYIADQPLASTSADADTLL